MVPGVSDLFLFVLEKMIIRMTFVKKNPFWLNTCDVISLENKKDLNLMCIQF